MTKQPAGCSPMTPGRVTVFCVMEQLIIDIYTDKLKSRKDLSCAN